MITKENWIPFLWNPKFVVSVIKLVFSAKLSSPPYIQVISFGGICIVIYVKNSRSCSLCQSPTFHVYNSFREISLCIKSPYQHSNIVMLIMDLHTGILKLFFLCLSFLLWFLFLKQPCSNWFHYSYHCWLLISSLWTWKIKIKMPSDCLSLILVLSGTNALLWCKVSVVERSQTTCSGLA